MVGVAGKYKGCNTCRVRRVKCDLGRPFCRKCTDNGRECAGYEREKVFIVGTPEQYGRCSSHPHRQRTNGKTAATGKKDQTKTTKNTKNINVNSKKTAESAKTTTTMIQRTPTIFFMNDVPENEAQLLSLCKHYLTLDLIYGDAVGLSSSGSIMEMIPKLMATSPPLRDALRAICLIHLGTTKHDDKLRRESTAIHSQALVQVRDALTDPVVAKASGTFAASIMLLLYEQTACTVEQVDAWKKLMAGSQYLIRERGPEMFQNNPDHHFFARMFRISAIFHAIASRKSTFLSELRWRTIPWQKIHKTSMDTLMDQVVLLPGLFEQTTRLLMSEPSQERERRARQYLTQLHEIHDSFDDWYDDLIKTNDQPMYWDRVDSSSMVYSPDSIISMDRYPSNAGSSPGHSSCHCSTPHGSTSDHLENDPELEFDFQGKKTFTNLGISLLHLYYWAGLLTLKAAVRIAYQIAEGAPPPTPPTSPQASNDSPSPPSTSSPSFTGGPTSPPPSRSPPLISPLGPLPPLDDVRYAHPALGHLAHNICQSIEYTLEQSLDQLGPDATSFPLWCAMQYFDRTKMRGWKKEEGPLEEGGKGYWDKEMNWCRRLHRRLQASGWGFGEQMGKIEWDRYM